MDDNTSNQPLRPLGPCEIFSSSRHTLGFYNCVANTCRYSIPRAGLEGRALRDVLDTAVANVVLDIPSLSVGIVGQDTSKPSFVRPWSINFEHHLEYVEHEDQGAGTHDSILVSILQGQHDRSWPDIERRPPWKLTVVARDAARGDSRLVFDAVFAVHHSLADGRSTALFHTKLLGELNRPSGMPAQLSGRVLDIRAAPKLLPPQEELAAFRTSWSFLVGTLWRELGPAWLQGRQPAAPWTGMPITREPCQTRLRLVTVSASAVPSILAACRENRTTLTPLLHALALASFTRHAPPQALAARSSTPIDLRPFISNDAQPDGSSRGLFGTYVTNQFHVFDEHALAALRKGLSTREVWKTAADLRHSMKQHLENVPNDDIMSMLGWVTDWRTFWLSKLGKPREDTWEVSNIGSMPGGEEEGWKIERSFMSQGATVAGAGVNISVAGVVGGEIGIVLGWQEGIVETDIVDGLARDLEIWLGRLGQGQREFLQD